ncbi:MAG: hypothetical protein ABSC19_11375 [Syntrophorhabdales bacterium]|jgi:hypothetical protein
MIEATIEKLLLMKLHGLAEGLKEQINNPHCGDVGFDPLPFPGNDTGKRSLLSQSKAFRPSHGRVLPYMYAREND